VVLLETLNVSLVLESDCESHVTEETWEIKSGQRQKRKRVRESSSPVSPSFAAVAASKINPITAGVVDARKGIRRVMIGHSTTSTIKASKN